MTESPTGQRKLRAAVPKGWTVAHKSGMMPATSNDVGVLTSPDGKTNIAIAIFAKGATSDFPTIDADVAAVTRAVIDALAP
jgi:beta-lactamase class A